MAISVNYYSGSYTYTAQRIQTGSKANETCTRTGYFFVVAASDQTVNLNPQFASVYGHGDYYVVSSGVRVARTPYKSINLVASYYDPDGRPAFEVVNCAINYMGVGQTKFTINDRSPARNGTKVYLYDQMGGRLLVKNGGTVTNGTLNGVVVQDTTNGILITNNTTKHADVTYTYRNSSKMETTLANGYKHAFSCTFSPTYSYTYTAPASASVSVTGLTASGTTVSISSAYSGRVLVSTDGSNYYYSSGTSLPVSLGTSSRTVYVAILSTSGSALGLSNGSSYSKSTLDSKISAYNTNETKNNNANSAASSFDSLYNSISGNINSLTSSNLSSLQSYLNTISSNSSTSDSRYTTRKAKYDTLNNKKNALDTAINTFDNLNLNTTPNNTTATEAKRQLDIILTNAGSSYEGYTSRLAKYNTYVANLTTTEQLSISVGSLRELHTNISGTMLPGKTSRYTEIHTRGTEEYNTTKTCIEKLLNRN